jgi:hypothetical protein
MTKLERATRFLNETARPGLRVLSLALLAASAYATNCTVGSGTTFNVTGLFDDGGLSSFGSYLSGTLDIDTTGCGGVLSASLVITANPEPTSSPLNFTGISSQGLENSGGYYYYVDFTPVDDYNLGLDIYLSSPATLDGYTGGNLCADNQSCGGAETYYGEDPNLSSGSLSAASGAPEPSSALLLFGGAAALIGLRQRKRRA